MVTETTTKETNWVIVSDEGTSTRPKKHTTYQSAREESIRLSKLKPGTNFAVYQFIGTAFTEKPVEPPTKFTAFSPVRPRIEEKFGSGWYAPRFSQYGF